MWTLLTSDWLHSEGLVSFSCSQHCSPGGLCGIWGALEKGTRGSTQLQIKMHFQFGYKTRSALFCYFSIFGCLGSPIAGLLRAP